MRHLSFCFRFLAAVQIALFSFSPSYGQAQQPVDHSIYLAAPHLPAIKKFEGAGEPFTYDGGTYKFDETIIKAWQAKYPKEYPAYLSAMDSLIKSTDTAKLAAPMKAVYSKLVAQLAMIKKVNN